MNLPNWKEISRSQWYKEIFHYPIANKTFCISRNTTPNSPQDTTYFIEIPLTSQKFDSDIAGFTYTFDNQRLCIIYGKFGDDKIFQTLSNIIFLKRLRIEDTLITTDQKINHLLSLTN